MTDHLLAWFDAVTRTVESVDPSAFVGIDLVEAKEQLELLRKREEPGPFTVRDLKGSSGQADGN